MTVAVALRVAGQTLLRAAGAMVCWWAYDTAVARLVRRP